MLERRAALVAMWHNIAHLCFLNHDETIKTTLIFE